MTAFSELIYDWYLLNFRKLPWRKTCDPYKIWVSEIILQQTRVNQGEAYYHRFLRLFPTVKALALAPEAHVLKAWQGLGYYSRARNMHKAARHIYKEFKGKFPSSYDAIRALPGVGDYTAAALASFCFNLPYPVVDGNVIRVLSRFEGIDEPVYTAKGKKLMYKLAGKHLPNSRAAIHNQAIMELGALVCTPIPQCHQCPVAENCIALRLHATRMWPLKKPKAAIRDRYFTYYVVTDGTHVLAHKRENEDIWKGLYDFPCRENFSSRGEKKFIQTLAGTLRYTTAGKFQLPDHLLSHQKLHIRFQVINTPGVKVHPGFVKMRWNTFRKKAHPLPVAKFLSGLSLTGSKQKS